MIDRLAIALVSAVFAGLTMLAWSVILIAVFGRADDSVGVAGFVIGGDRMAAIFSALWGTHSAWTRFNTWLGEKLEPLNEEYNVATPWLIAALVICALAAWFMFKP